MSEPCFPSRKNGFPGASSSLIVAVTLTLAVAMAAGAAVRDGQEAAARRSTRDGVYTDAQANRGEREFGRTCEHCHGAGLEGDAAKEIPALVSDPFIRKWNGKTLKELFDVLSQSMPADNRGSLSARVYTDVIAYLLRANGAPAGTSTLPDANGLEAIVIEN